MVNGGVEARWHQRCDLDLSGSLPLLHLLHRVVFISQQLRLRLCCWLMFQTQPGGGIDGN